MPSPRSEARGFSGQLLFGVAIFLSAFLIFLVQPMVGKRILPWFGGTPAVWTLCLAFYQTTLFLGYAYAHLLIRFAPPTAQLVIHGLAIAGALASLPVLPGVASQPSGVESPSADILAMLIANVGLPFLVLASTGPLVQAWFVRRNPRLSPYPLYALSNVGSLLAVVTYPFFLEPRLTLSYTGTLWSFAFGLAGLAVMGCAALAWRATSAATATAGDDDPEPIGPVPVSLWFLLSAAAVVVLMGVTNFLCLDVASVPFLWILPLGTYLVTFIVCFGSERAYRRGPFVSLAAVAAAVSVLGFLWLRWLPSLPPQLKAVLTSAPTQIATYCVLLFSVCMVMHGELYRLRPPPRALTTFYLCVSAGGALGGLFVGIAAPLLFVGYHELAFGLLFAAVLLIAVCAGDPRSVLSVKAPIWRLLTAASMAVIAGGYVSFLLLSLPDHVLLQERSFFGVVRVFEGNKGTKNHQIQLSNGTTLHGVQFQNLPGRRSPTSYYGRASGIGMVMSLRESNAPRRVGVIGLGVGTMAAYGRKGDLFRFYEINPAVLRIAGRDGFFDYLENSAATIEVVLGDARLSLADEQARQVEQNFDVLVLDAFTSDAIPVHLLTREAFVIYSKALASHGVLAVHVSNRHFRLMPMVARQGLEAGMESLQIQTHDVPRYQSASAEWVLLSHDAERLARLARYIPRRYQAMDLAPGSIEVVRSDDVLIKHIRLWTDDFSDLLGPLL